MYILVVDYIRPSEEVSLYVATHAEWVKKHIAAGTFLFAGPKKNKAGGVIVVKSIDRAVLMQLIAEDSFVVNAVAKYSVVDFDCKLTVACFNALATM